MAHNRQERVVVLVTVQTESEGRPLEHGTRIG